MSKGQTATSPLPRDVFRFFTRDAVSSIPALLKIARVENATFFRLGIAGDVVTPKRTYSAFLVLERPTEVVAASCACSSYIDSKKLCAHIGALVCHVAGSSASSPGPLSMWTLPGERFAESLWYATFRAFFDEEPSSPAQTGASTDDATKELVFSARARRSLIDDMIVRLPANPAREERFAAIRRAFEPVPLASRWEDLDDRPKYAPLDAVAAKENRLRRMTETQIESSLRYLGQKTRQQGWEDSAWFRLAQALFLTFSEPLSSTTATFLDGRIFLRHSDATTGAIVELRPPETAVLTLLRRDEGQFFGERGFKVLKDALEPSVRLSLEGDGLKLIPALVYCEGNAAPPISFDRLTAPRFGEYFLLADKAVFATVQSSGPLFAEEAGPSQGLLNFEEAYTPSPLGIPSELVVTVPAKDTVRFLGRHAGEISRLPEALVPEALRAGGMPSRLPGDVRLVLEGEAEGFFTLNVEYPDQDGRPATERKRSGGRAVLSFSDILDARRKGQLFLAHGGRLLDLSDDALSWMDSLPSRAIVGKGRARKLRLSALEILRLRAYVRGTLDVSGEPRAIEKLSFLENETSAEAPTGESLGMRLYSFQENGLAWLWFLFRNGFGGLLCDDMGLGKTHQAMALMRALARTAAKSAAASASVPRFLVVCPASLLPHWEDKLKAFVSDLPIAVYHGLRRSSVGGPGVTVTSFGMVRSDVERFVGEPFDLLVVDEIQTIKNRGTATHQALSRLPSRFSLGLTGTPVENHPGELRTLLDFVLPGYLPSEAEFFARFTAPLEQRGPSADEARRRLAKLIHPFVLRRSKEKVLPDLPEKIIDVRHCELSTEQETLYDDVVNGRARPLAETLGDSGATAHIPYIHIFAVLSELKQICNHPESRTGAGGDYRASSSGKWNLFTELLDECLGSGLKVVVFSQYVKMIALFQSYLRDRGTEFETLTGSTVDRGAVLRRFQEDEGCHVFLASLKAGGLGVDLTAASVVIHYDRWWNQAREDQATDRVHRIGQKRGVQVLKLITKNTLEEKIDAIIARKRELASQLVKEDDPSIAKKFTREELRTLLSR